MEAGALAGAAALALSAGPLASPAPALSLCASASAAWAVLLAVLNEAERLAPLIDSHALTPGVLRDSLDLPLIAVILAVSCLSWKAARRLLRSPHPRSN